ncbi:MAG: hypothetical protein SFX18_07900 [Pirellulales bacterium]|nr:hypothetical protein [Pirellulales bacterium]
MPRFALLEHIGTPTYKPGAHYDLLLEAVAGDGMWAWELTSNPCDCGAGRRENIPARRLPDHRTLYLDYEGPISGDRGNVRRIAAGEYRLSDSESEDTADWISIEILGPAWQARIWLPLVLTPVDDVARVAQILNQSNEEASFCDPVK